MAIRTIAYGYGINNGDIVIVEQEANIIKSIFSDYISGKLLREIAEKLTQNKVEFLDGNFLWNKNRVDRIIQNSKYTGCGGYPEIISQSIFDEANDKKTAKGAKKQEQSEEIEHLKKIVVCGECGKRVTRISKWRSREKWLCRSCNVDDYIDDKKLSNYILKIVGKINENPELLNAVSSNPTYNRTPEIVRCNKELTVLMNSRNPSFKVGKKIILNAAALKFKECSYNGAEYDEYILSETRRVAKDGIDKVFFTKVIDKIIMHKDGHIVLKFINGIEIGSADERGA